MRGKSKWQICFVCRGDGTHVNPSIDGNGLTREDFDEDPDFADAYMSGVYDIRCDACDGTGKQLTADVDAKRQRLHDNAAERRLAALEDGNFEAYCHASDYRYG
jgi:hypothetical protein